MYALAVVALSMSLFGVVLLIGKPAPSFEASSPANPAATPLLYQAQSIARAIEVYHAASMEWSRLNPTATGSVPHPPATATSLPSAFIQDIRSVIVGGHLVTYPASLPTGVTGSMLEAELQRGHGFANGVGIVYPIAVTSTRDAITWSVTVPAVQGIAVRINRL